MFKPRYNGRLPANLDAERAVLGAVLLDNAAFAPAAEVLTARDFSHEGHRQLWCRMVHAHTRGVAIDPITLTEELLRTNELEAVGGPAYLSALTESLPRSVNAAHYAAIVREKAHLRRLATAAYNAYQRALEPRAELGEIAELLSAAVKEGVPAERKVNFRTAAEIEAETPASVDWIAQPWLAAGAITEVVGKIKAAGKTTWLLALCRAVLRGELFLGEPTQKTAIVYLTEQSPTTFRVALERARLLGQESLLVLCWHETQGTAWEIVVRHAVAKCKAIGARLLVVDTLGQFAGLQGDAENNAGDALLAIRPLQLAAAEGLAVAVARHERKSGGEVGDSGRGSSAFAGAVDTVLSLRRAEGNARPTLRVLRGLSRFSEVPEVLVVELTPEGYVVAGTSPAVALQEAEEAILRAAPQTEEEAITLKGLCQAAKVKRTTGQEVIDALIRRVRLLKTGKGVRGDPYRFYKVPAATPVTSGIKKNGGLNPCLRIHSAGTSPIGAAERKTHL